jgi:hypothetical protein
MHRFAEGGTHIHAHGLDGLAVIEAFEQAHDVIFGAPSTHFQHLPLVQIAENRIVAMALAPRKFINAQLAWRG